MALNIDWQQILLHLFNFVILFAIMYFLLYKPVKDFMDKRTQYYKSIDDEAKKKLADAEKLQGEHSLKMAEVENEIASARHKAFEELETSIENSKKQAEKEAGKIISDAKQSALKEREKIMKEAQGEIAEMVTDAAAKIFSNDGSDSAIDSFIEAAQRGESDE